jgi:asparagine synthase (glutamine-hydrolysing)
VLASEAAGVLPSDINPAALRFRAPNGERAEQAGEIGFACAAMHIEGDPPLGRQPLCLDDRWWIAGDVRLYDRPSLVRRLRGAGAEVRLEVPDAWLILLAYRAWGEACLMHLNGDFSFVLWDSHRRELMAATDRFGMRPVFYGVQDRKLFLSNTLDALTAIAGWPLALNDLYIADFLCFELSLEPSATVYSTIRRVPPAHLLRVSWRQDPRVSRYWDLPAPEWRMSVSRAEVRQEFLDTLRAAVTDRLPAGPASLWLSGGTDSTSIAAIAVDDGRATLVSHTAGSAGLVNDPEPPLAAMVAEALGIAHQFMDIDAHLPYEHWQERPPFMPEPWHEPYLHRKRMGLRQVAQHSRVVLGGEGADELLGAELAADLVGRVPLPILAGDIVAHLRRYRRLPPMGVRKTLRRLAGSRQRYGVFEDVPGWLNPDFVRDLRLQDRMDHYFRTADEPLRHPRRPMGANRLHWSTLVTRDTTDPGTTGVSLEMRKPFLDVRLVTLLYSVPPLYWCSRKALLRESLQSRLPPAIVARPKTSVRGNLLWEHLKRRQQLGIPEISPGLGKYIDLRELARLGAARLPAAPPITLLRDLIPWSINHWLSIRHEVRR